MQNPLASDLDHILNHTRDLWDELRGQRIFITGGTGFFGCWLLESFIWANEKLNLKARATVLTRAPDAFRIKAPHLARNEAVTLISGDVRTFEFPKETFSHIIHAATESSSKLSNENPLVMLDTIIEGTRQTLDFAKICGARKFLLTSSGAVYGKQPPDMTHVPEDYSGAPDPMDPKSAYGQGKRIAEHLCALYADSSLEIKIARCFAFVGPYLPLDVHFAIGNFIRDGLNGGPIVIKGDGTPYRSYLYAADLAIWLWTILFKGQSCRPYNVGNDLSMAVGKLADAVAQIFTSKPSVRILKTANSSKPIERYVPSIKRVSSELSLQPLINLQTGIQQTIVWNSSIAGGKVKWQN
ncbi:MAG: NAD-dependent epimerase/dehydratase family protein [Anaerolineales bacterium]